MWKTYSFCLWFYLSILLEHIVYMVDISKCHWLQSSIEEQLHATDAGLLFQSV